MKTVFSSISQVCNINFADRYSQKWILNDLNEISAIVTTLYLIFSINVKSVSQNIKYNW